MTNELAIIDNHENAGENDDNWKYSPLGHNCEDDNDDDTDDDIDDNCKDNNNDDTDNDIDDNCNWK